MRITKGTVCTIAGMVGVAVTGFLAFKAGQKSVIVKVPEKETKKEKAIRLAKTYGPAVAAGVATEVVIFAGDRIHVKEELGLASAVAAANHVVNVQKKVTEEVAGEEKAKEINQEVKKRLKPEELSPSELANAIKVYEPYTGQYIWTTRETVAWVMLEANRRLQKDLVCKINTIATGLGGKATEEGEEYQWDFESNTLDYNWGFFNMGPWIDIQLIPKQHGPEMILELDYTVPPIKPCWEDKIYAESN